MPQKYRKKPVVIEAMKLTRENNVKVCSWIAEHERSMRIAISENGVEIPTLEGTMLANYGDYIIKGIAGELYPCKPKIFEATYEAV